MQGLFYATLSGSWGSVASLAVLSNGFVEPNEASLAGLEDGPRQTFAREVELGHRFAVDLDATLPDETSSFARRQTKCVGQERWQMDGISRRERVLRDVLRRLPFANDTREMLLGGARRVLPMRARDDEARERELCLERLTVGHRLLCDEPPPLLELRVGD